MDSDSHGAPRSSNFMWWAKFWLAALVAQSLFGMGLSKYFPLRSDETAMRLHTFETIPENTNSPSEPASHRAGGRKLVCQ